jgi:hypothetical protein
MLGHGSEVTRVTQFLPGKAPLSQTTISERVKYDFYDNPADMITIPSE